MALKPADSASPDHRIGELYRQASAEEPSARLDATIRAAAHSEPYRPAVAARQAWWMPWRLPFAVAAVAVVSGSLALLVYEEQPKPPAEAPLPPLSAPASPPAATGGVSSSPEEKAERDRAADARPPAVEPSGNQTAIRKKESTAAEAEPRFAPEPPPEAKTQGRADAQSLEARRELRSADAPRGDSTPAPAAVAAPAPPAAADSGPAAPRERAARVSPSAPTQAPLAKKAEAGAYLDIAVLVRDLEREPARRWVERIAELRRAGRLAEADALSAEFKRRFPDEPLPAAAQ